MINVGVMFIVLLPMKFLQGGSEIISGEGVKLFLVY